MLTYDLQNCHHQALYAYLYDCIREDILAARLRPGQKLPSKRAFAKQNAVSTITVENAYAQLIAEGYLYAVPKRGYFVSDLGDVRLLRPSQETVAAQAAPEQKKEEAFADFASNQTAPESFPFATWAKLSRRILSEQKMQLMTNPPSGGVWELRSAIAGHLSAFRGLQVLPEQIIVGAGTEYLLGLLIQLLGLDRVYGCEYPGYQKVSRIYAAYGVQAVRLPMEESGISVRALEGSAASVVHVTPSHHFPTGITMPATRRYELLHWARQGGERYLIEDDYDSEFRMNGKPLLPLGAMDPSHVIFMNTFTKTLASTIRISYMVLPPSLLEQFRRKLPFYSCSVSTFEQYTLAAFLSEGYFEKHINRMRNASRRKRDALLAAFQACPLQGRIAIAEENAGLHFLMNINPVGGADRFRANLAREQIRMVSLDAFLDPGGPQVSIRCPGDGQASHTFVVNYSTVPQERIREAVRRICRAAGMDEEQ